MMESADAEALVSTRADTIVRDVDPPVVTDNNNTHKSRRSTFLILEPAVLMIFFAMNLSGALYQNQIIYQTCKVIFDFNETECLPLMGVTKESERSMEIETLVQPYVAKILMTRTLLESIIPSLISLFIGPWSDKFGRKPVILSTFSGYFFGFLTMIVITLFSLKYPVTPWLYVLTSVPIVLSGGICTLITGIYCYAADVSDPVNGRALRMVLMEIFICTGLMAGTLLSSYIYVATNVLTVFSISAVAIFLAILYITAFVEESLKPVQISSGSKFKEFFHWALAKDVFKTCFERRAKYDRMIIWLTMGSLALSMFVMEGDATVMYLFVREKFEWTLKDYTVFNAVSISFQMVVSGLVMLVFRKIFKFSITSMALLALASSHLESLVRATASYSWQLYLAMALGFMKSIGGPMCRAILSHVAPASDLGKIFSFTTSLETISPLGSAPLYTYVYSETIQHSPGAFNFISSGVYFLCYVFLAIVFGIQKSYPNTTYEAIGS